MLEQQADAREYELGPVFPEEGAEGQTAQVAAVRDWLKSLPLARRRLVKVHISEAPSMLHRALPLWSCFVTNPKFK